MMKTDNTITNKTVAEIVAYDFRTAEVFKKHGIDFCCGGKKSIEQVCIEKNMKAEILKDEVENVMTQGKVATQNFDDWKLSLLVDYIINIHHSYVKNNLALIAEFTSKVAKVHGQQNPEIIEINELWENISDELIPHMQKEELILFPYIRNLERYAAKDINVFPSSHFKTIKTPVQMMEHEHETVGEWLHRIQILSNDFMPPDYACNTYKVLYAKLGEFQNDLHQHIHLENNILFPKAIKLEEITATF